MPITAVPPVSEVLSQAEIEALLAGRYPRSAAHEQAADRAAVPEPARLAQEAEDSRPKRYDFRLPGRLTREQQRAIQVVHDQWCRQLGTALSAGLRAPVRAEVLAVQQMPFREFLSRSGEAVLYVISARAIEGHILLAIDMRLGYLMLERLLGGEGVLAGMGRAPTEIEGRVLDTVTSQMLRLLDESWHPVGRLGLQIEQRETDQQFARIANDAETVVAVAAEVHVGDAAGPVEVCMPALPLGRLVGALASERWRKQRPQPPPAEVRKAIRERLCATQATLSVVLGRARLAAADLAGLEVGDVIPLDRAVSAELEMKVGCVTRFRVRPGALGRHLAVKITGVVYGEAGEDA